MTDKLDIFEMPMDAKIITTIEELQRLYLTAFDDGNVMEWPAPEDKPVIVRGDIV